MYLFESQGDGEGESHRDLFVYSTYFFYSLNGQDIQSWLSLKPRAKDSIQMPHIGITGPGT